MPFRRGPEINPFIGASQEPMVLLESVTPVELASCVPLVKITKIDPRTGRPMDDVRPLMFDLTQGADTTGRKSDFGFDLDRFMERPLISLNSLQVKSDMKYGFMLFRDVTLEFTVHRPDIVFDRFSPLGWKEILEEGRSFSLEYGWVADPTLCKNPLFNGIGHVTPSGRVLKSHSTILLVVYRYKVNLTDNGEARVTVEAKENSDIALREARFSDTFERAFGGDPAGDRKNVERLRVLLGGLTQHIQPGRGVLYEMGEILDSVVAPMIETATRAFGYAADSPVEMLLANFNSRAGRQSAKFGGAEMAGKSLGDFMVPADRLRDALSTHFAQGRSMFLRNFINILIGIMNEADAWGADERQDRQKPEVALKTDTIRTPDGSLRLILMICDRKVSTDVFKEVETLPLRSQSRSDVMKALASRDVPVIEFGRAGSAILGASFDMQPDPLLQAIQIDEAYRDRKDRVEKSQMPDVESRQGKAGSKDIVPLSILEGEITMIGNFVVDTFGTFWIDFFGSSAISGIFNVLEKTDNIEPGKFQSTFKVISEGIDPLGTRRRRTSAE